MFAITEILSNVILHTFELSNKRKKNKMKPLEKCCTRWEWLEHRNVIAFVTKHFLTLYQEKVATFCLTVTGLYQTGNKV